MPRITDPAPADIEAELALQRDALDDPTTGIPAKSLDRNLLIATWNLRAFGGLTEKWVSEEGDSPKRDLQSLRVIAEVIRRFDVVAVQEIRGNLKALRHMLRVLGPAWSFIMTDVTRGKSGNDERMAYLFDTRRVRLSGLAAELVVPQEELDAIDEGALRRQFARTPYAVSFWSEGKTFILVTLHVLYGKKADERVPELRAIAKWLSAWAQDMHSWDHNLIALGDFNIDRKGDPLYRAFTSTGLTPPDDMNGFPRTVFDKPGEESEQNYYDQIAWFTGADGRTPALSLDYVRSGYVDFTQWALKSRDLTRTELSWRISDHYPLWAEFSIR